MGDSGIGSSEILLTIGMFALTFVLSLLVVGGLLVWIPATFFLDHHDRNLWVDRHPVIRWTGLIIKNLTGLVLILIGLLLSLPGVPGQGLLTILIGLVLLDIPGKRRLERMIVSRPKILKLANRMRARFGKSPLDLTDSESQPS
jgi:hypothetical protein